MIISLIVIVALAIGGTVYVLTRKPQAEPTLPVNHKGEPCIVDTKLCQEGYCSNCQIYRDYLNNTKNKKV
jgi:hypothetical protein